MVQRLCTDNGYSAPMNILAFQRILPCTDEQAQGFLFTSPGQLLLNLSSYAAECTRVINMDH